MSHPDPSLAAEQPSSSRVPPAGDESSVLQTFQDKFSHFGPERFQEVKAEAGALRSSRGMRLWNVAWLRCQEARQQLQERTQDTGDASQREPDPGGWGQRHYVDVESLHVQTSPPGGRGLRVQSTPGPGHPDWEDIVSGEKDLETRQAALSNSAANLAQAAGGDLTEPSSKGSKVTPPSPSR